MVVQLQFLEWRASSRQLNVQQVLQVVTKTFSLKVCHFEAKRSVYHDAWRDSSEQMQLNSFMQLSCSRVQRTLIGVFSWIRGYTHDEYERTGKFEEGESSSWNRFFLMPIEKRGRAWHSKIHKLDNYTCGSKSSTTFRKHEVFHHFLCKLNAVAAFFGHQIKEKATKYSQLTNKPWNTQSQNKSAIGLLLSHSPRLLWDDL